MDNLKVLISAPPCIFKLNYFPFFGLYSQAETTGLITETSKLSLNPKEGNIFKNF